MNVLVISRSDHAGSGQRFAAALRGAGHTARLAAWHRNPYGYPVDVMVPNEPDVFDELFRLADVLHFKGDWTASSYKLPLDGRLVVHTVCGSGYRRAPKRSAQQPHEQGWHPIPDYLVGVHAFSAITPDLIYPDTRTDWIPHTLPRSPLRSSLPPERGPIIIGHSPSSRSTKGTDTVVIPAIDMLRRAGYPVKLQLIEGMSNARCLEEKAKCHLFFDQAVLPAYGMAAVEALSMGTPVITRLPATTREKDPRLSMAQCPIIGFEDSTAHSAAMAIATALRANKITELHELRTWTREYFNRVHGEDAVARQLVQFYQNAERIRKAA